MEADKYIAEAEACLTDGADVTPRTDVTASLVDFTNVQRYATGRSELDTLDTLQQAAFLHASDMAARAYAAHTDLEGRSHLDRVRMLDRQSLFGAFGANVTVVSSDATFAEIEQALASDPANAANLVRNKFNSTGVAAVEKDGKIFVVQLFAEKLGELDRPLPVSVQQGEKVKVRLASSGLERVRWSVVSPGGTELAAGRSQRLTDLPAEAGQGYLNVEIRYGGQSSTLQGPAMLIK
ncbi:MAG: CAP domain-containing protein [Hyphomonas sp.]|nr:CAP domain-containing protein [Hyphomonas sp.]